MTLPSYKIRYSKKAKHLQLRISVHGLEVVIPNKKLFNKNKIEQFIQEKQHWIERNWQRHLLVKEESTHLPQTIHLQAIDQIWEVCYLATDSPRLKLLANQSKQIKLIGDVTQKDQCLTLLRRWLKTKAEVYLVEKLYVVSKEIGLSFNQVTIRNNLTRWGSCSSEKDISLCCKLLFLPPILVRHVLLHELCHTKIMNHSKAFWNLLAQFDVLATTHAKQLKLAAAHVPWWSKSGVRK